MKKRTARIFEDVGGYYVCDEDLPYLDTRGHAYPNKRAALGAAYECGYTHAVGSGAYHQNGSILGMIRPSIYERRAREQNQAYQTDYDYLINNDGIEVDDPGYFE